MIRYILWRLVQAALTLFGVLTLVFFGVRASGSPVRLLVPQNASAADIARLTRQLGLDKPLWQQYLQFIANALHGNLGYSYVQGQSALSIVLSRFPNTVELAVSALILAIVVGVPVGILSAIYRGKWVERLLMPLVLIGQSMPAFWSGILLILLFSVHFHVLPSSGKAGLNTFILPTVVLASLTMATIARITRGSFLEHLEREYVRTARAKGASEVRVNLRHILRNAILPVLTIVGLEAGNLLGGAVVVETIFAWPGMGQLTVQSVQARDFPVVEAVVLFAAVVYILTNLVVDLLYGVVDPRLRTARAA